MTPTEPAADIQPIAPRVALADGRSIPQLGLGVYKVPPAQTADLVTAALQFGYRHVDTAALYGNEREVGVGVRASELPRGEVFVTSKVWDDDHGFDETRRAFDTSLAATGLDYLDLYLIHWPVPSADRYVDTWRALIELRDEGRVRSIGVSNFEPHHVQRLIDETGVTPVVNQVELHPRLPQHAVRVADAERGIVTESWSPLARGTLLADPVLADLARKHNRSPAQIVLRWHVQQGLVVIPKSMSIERIRSNADIFDWMLDADDLVAIASLDTGERTGMHPDEH